MSQPFSAIHINKSLKSQPSEPKLVKEYSFANADRRQENKARKHNIVDSTLQDPAPPYTERYA